MVSYNYKRLNVRNEEIRLISLMPGKTEDDICFSIFHAPITPPPAKSTSNRPTLEEIEQTLPGDWTVRETLEGRYLFIQRGTSGRPNSWMHPDPSFDSSSLDPPTQRPLPDFEPKYEALSYTWGPTTNPVTAHVVDSSDCTLPQPHIQIRANLACALQHLRYHDRPRTLWVDALCINQDDVDERNAQVKRIGAIYSLAQRVVVWLGPEAEDSDLAISSLVYFGAQVEYFTDENLGDSPGATEPQWWRPAYQLPYDQQTWSSLIALFRRPWFSRVWVLQEALLANQEAVVHCGRTSCPWAVLRKIILILPGKYGVPRELASLIDSHRIALLGGAKRSFARLMLWASYRQCTNPRDKVYGVLNLVSPAISKKIDPQYATPVSQVYITTFLAFLDHVKRLELLGQCNIAHRSTELPSWVPNWAENSGLPSGHTIRFVRQPSGLSAAHTRLLSSDTLEVVGRRCTQVSSVNDRASTNRGDVLSAIRLWEPENLQTEAYVSGGSLFDAFLEVGVQGLTRERTPYVHNMPTIAELRNEYQALLSGKLSSGETLPFLERFLRVDMLSMLTTKDGHLGVAPQGAKEGEQSCAKNLYDC